MGSPIVNGGALVNIWYGEEFKFCHITMMIVVILTIMMIKWISGMNDWCRAGKWYRDIHSSMMYQEHSFCTNQEWRADRSAGAVWSQEERPCHADGLWQMLPWTEVCKQLTGYECLGCIGHAHHHKFEGGSHCANWERQLHTEVVGRYIQGCMIWFWRDIEVWNSILVWLIFEIWYDWQAALYLLTVAQIYSWLVQSLCSSGQHTDSH